MARSFFKGSDIMQENNHPCCLTIAGSDSGGGAGIQADIKTMTVLGCYASSVVTALTAQNGLGVTGIHAPDPHFVVLQLRAILDGFSVRAAKTGMLFSAEIIQALADILKQTDFPLVVDPVCVSQSGHALLKQDAVEALRFRILPQATLLTPNRPEAELLAGVKINDEADIAIAASRLFNMGAKAVLIKGGHFETDGKGRLVDWLCLPGVPAEPLFQEKVETHNNHGTGCTLSAAIAAGLAKGLMLREAVIQAQKYLNLCLRESYTPGKGFGPVNHLAPFEIEKKSVQDKKSQ